MQKLSADTYRKMIADTAKPKAKYRNKKVVVATDAGSITFDSTKESRRYHELMLLQKRGEITRLELQPTFPLVVGGVPIRDSRGVVRKYKADFRYLIRPGRIVVEDVKSAITAKDKVYRLKMDIMRAAYPDVVIEEL
jgi:glycine/D-amino acid oxidase-like deaminating enzyme